MSLTAVGGALLFLSIGFAGTWLARRYALARRLLDEPGERRSHNVATPRGGGIAIVVAVLVAVAIGWSALGGGLALAAFATGFALVAAIGWVDDHRPLSPALRLLVHVLASALFAAAVHAGSGAPATVAIAFLAPLVLTNVWNFMDGIDGLAASQALIVGGLLALGLGGPWPLVALALAAACAGFLPFNLPTARIFMGDVGSGAIGYAIGALCAIAAEQGGTAAAWLLLPLAPFLVDAGLTLARRVLRRERWWTAHTQHAYQACARRHGHRAVTLGYALATLAGAAVALIMKEHVTTFIASSLFTWYMSAAILWGWLQYSRGAGTDAAAPSWKENE